MKSSIILYTLAAALALLTYLPWSNIDYGTPDLAETLYHAQALKEGNVPYRDSYSHHFLGYIVPLALFESITPLTPPVHKTLNLIYFLLTMAFGAAAARLLFGPAACRGFAFLYGTLAWAPPLQGTTFNVQSHILPLLAAYIWLCSKALRKQELSSLFWAAFLCGALLTYDQRLFTAPFLLLVPLTTNASWRSGKTFLTTLCLIAVLPLSALAALFLAQGLRDFYFQTIIFPLFGRNVSHSSSFFEMLSTFFFQLTRGAPFVILYFGLGAVSFWRMKASKSVVVFLFLPFFITGSYALLGGRAYGNYLLLLIFSFLLIGSRIFEWGMRRGRNSARFCILLFPALIWGLFPLLQNLSQDKLFTLRENKTLKEASAYIQEMTKPEESILVWGYAPSLYLRSDRKSSLPDISLLFLTSDTKTIEHQGLRNYLEKIQLTMLEELQSSPPSAWITYKTNTPERALSLNEAVLKSFLLEQKSEPLRNVRNACAQQKELSANKSGRIIVRLCSGTLPQKGTNSSTPTRHTQSS